MQETIARCQARDDRTHRQRRTRRRRSGHSPVGLIFHVARCGSTLDLAVAQENRRPRRLRRAAASQRDPATTARVAAPRAGGRASSTGAAFARHARQPYCLKLTSWNTLYCDLLAEAFPQAPWVLALVRSRRSRASSLLARPPGWSGDAAGRRPAASAAVVDPAGASKTSREEFIARVYGAFCEAAARLDPSRGRLVPVRGAPGRSMGSRGTTPRDPSVEAATARTASRGPHVRTRRRRSGAQRVSCRDAAGQNRPPHPLNFA